MSRLGKSIETEGRLVVAQGWEEWGGWGMKMGLKSIVVMVAQFCAYTKKHCIVHVK